MSIPRTDGRLHLRVPVDRTTVEIFVDRGQAYGMFVCSHPGGNAALEWSVISRVSEEENGTRYWYDLIYEFMVPFNAVAELERFRKRRSENFAALNAAVLPKLRELCLEPVR